MKLGPMEIGIILVIALIVFTITRMMRIGKNTAAKDKAPVTRKKPAASNDEVKSVRRSRIQVMGIIFVLVGVLILLSNLNLIKWIFWGNILAYIIAAIGLVTIFVARRRP